MSSKRAAESCPSCGKQAQNSNATIKTNKSQPGDTTHQEISGNFDAEILSDVLSVAQPVVAKITIKQRSPDHGPVGRITKNQEMDLIGGRFVHTCHCGKSNGLSYECRRLACQGDNPGCKMNPPQCWPKYRPPAEKVSEIECPVRLCYADQSKITAQNARTGHMHSKFY